MLHQIRFVKFTQQSRIGAILRIFATKAVDVQKRVDMARETVRRLLAANANGLRIVDQIEIVIWTDPRFPDADCGETLGAMRQEFGSDADVVVSECKHGDLFCGLLNRACADLYARGMTHALIISPDASGYISDETLTEMVNVASVDGIKVTGVAIEELQQSVCDGRVANTFALWDIASLLTVGGFDLRAAKVIDPAAAPRYFHYKGKDEVLQGVEEVLTLVRLVETFGGQPIGVVLPRGNGETMRYIVPDEATQPELYARHVKKMGTKLERQAAFLALEGKELRFLSNAVAIVH